MEEAATSRGLERRLSHLDEDADRFYGRPSCTGCRGRVVGRSAGSNGVPVSRRRGPVMRFPRARSFWCPTVSEPVLIRLTRPPGLTRATPDYFVQCDQTDCQYVETNAHPPPLPGAL